MTKLGLDTTQFQRGMAGSMKLLKSFARAGAVLVVGAIGLMTRAAINLGSRISDMSIQLNIGTTALQSLQFSAIKAGVEVGILERALRNVQTRTSEAINGNKRYAEAFDRLGINIKAFAELSIEKRLEAIAIAQSNATDKASAYNDIAIILGERAGPKMQEILKELAGPGGYQGLEEAAKDAGQVMTTDTIERMDKVSDRIKLTKNWWTVLTSHILSVVVPAFGVLGGWVRAVGQALILLGKDVFSFGKALAVIVTGAMQPAISAFESLGLAALAAKAAIQGQFAISKELFKAAKDAIAEVKDEITDMPSVISDAFGVFKDEASDALDVFGEKAEEIDDQITSDWNNLGGTIRGVENAVDKVGEAADKVSESKLFNGDNADILSGKGSSKKKTKEDRQAEKSFEKGDVNRDSILTDKEIRAQEREGRKQKSGARRAMTRAVHEESTVDMRQRRSGRDDRMTTREQAAGLFNTTAGRPGSGQLAMAAQAKKPVDPAAAESKKQTEALKSMDEKMNILGKLDASLSGD